MHHPQYGVERLYKKESKCQGICPNRARGWEDSRNKPPPVLTPASRVRIVNLQAQNWCCHTCITAKVRKSLYDYQETTEVEMDLMA